MADYYHAPALILTALLLPAFAYLYQRFRNTRTLLWLGGLTCSVVSMLLLYSLGPSGVPGSASPWPQAIGQTALLISSALFLASLSPATIKLGRLRILYVFPYILPLAAFSVLFYGFWRSSAPPFIGTLTLLALGLLSLLVAFFWSSSRFMLPTRIAVTSYLVLGALAFWALFVHGPEWSLSFVESANFFMTALLLIFAFRKLSPGVLLSVLGFLTWSLPISHVFSSVQNDPVLNLHVTQAFEMGKVIAAVGMILLILEDQMTLNNAAQERARRARRELESYTRIILARRRLEDFDRQGSEICETVAAQSRFSKVGLILHSGGRYRLTGAAGLEPPVVKALDELAARFPATGLPDPGSSPTAVAGSQTVRLSLEPWLCPGDDLKRFGMTSVLAVPMLNRNVMDGVLLLSGIRHVPECGSDSGPDSLSADDLLPIEMLATRLQATRSQTMMFEKLIDSEKFGHLGQLATTVTQQLNNPLTVVLGYASLLEGTASLDAQDRKAVESILTEARHMRRTIESLSRIARPQSDSLAAVSVAELLSDLGELHRPEFLQRSIEFRLNLAPNLPRVMCSAPQLRQAVRHCLQFAIEAVESAGASPHEPRTIRLEAATEGSNVKIMVAHSGPGFTSPDRAFDPFVPPQIGATGLSLSLCATVMRNNNGRASALNFQPRGAAIVLELKAA
jgi:signal transduction histidine kinase